MDESVIHRSAAAYALDALSAAEERAYEEHLAVCEQCQQEVAGFTEVAAALAYAAPAAELPPGLRERILAGVRAGRSDVVTLRPRWAYAAVGVAAIAACVAIGLGLWAFTLHGRPGQGIEALPLDGARGSLVVTHGGEAALVVSGLPRPPAGKTYEVWVMRHGVSRPAGLFSVAGGTARVHLTRAVPSGAKVGVTLERAGGSLRPTQRPLFTSARV